MSDVPENVEANHDSLEVSVKNEPLSDAEEVAEETFDGDDQPATKRTKRTPPYSQLQLQLAYEAVQSGMDLKEAVRKYGIPRTTLEYRVRKKMADLDTKRGRKNFLDRSEELPIFNVLNELASGGFQLSFRLVQTVAKEYIKEFLARNPFPSGIPAKSWVGLFFKRHPELAKRVSENWARYDGGKVMPEHVGTWFGCATRYLERVGGMGALQNREQVFTVDDVQLEMKKSCKDVTFSCLFGADAYGNLLPPLVLYPAEVTIQPKKEQVGMKYAVAYQDVELTAGNALYQWLSNVFQPWLIEENVPRPVILFVDGHRVQMGYRSSEFCKQHQIILVSLLPRSDHMPRPLNAKLFGPMKQLWREEVKQAAKVKFTSVEHLLKPVLDQLNNTEKIIRSGFFKSGIFPWNPEGHAADTVSLEPEVVKVRKNAKKPPPRKPVDPMVSVFRRMFESRLSVQQLAEFEAKRYEASWQGPVEDTNLFRMWQDLLNEMEAAEPEPQEIVGEVKSEIMNTTQEEGQQLSTEIVKEEPRTEFEDL